jgi:hypothetical protein
LLAQQPGETPSDNTDIKISYQASATCTKDLRLALALGSAKLLTPSGELNQIEFSYDGRKKSEEHYVILYRDGNKNYKITHKANDEGRADLGNSPNPSPGAIAANRIAEFVFQERGSSCQKGGQQPRTQASVSSSKHAGRATSQETSSSTTQPPSPAMATPAAAPPTIEPGQTRDQIVAILGQPERIANVGDKQIYIYKDPKVTLIAGKVTDIQ